MNTEMHWRKQRFGLLQGSNMVYPSPGPVAGSSSSVHLGHLYTQLWISQTRTHVIFPRPPVKKWTPGGEGHIG